MILWVSVPTLHWGSRADVRGSAISLVKVELVGEIVVLSLLQGKQRRKLLWCWQQSFWTAVTDLRFSTFVCVIIKSYKTQRTKKRLNDVISGSKVRLSTWEAISLRNIWKAGDAGDECQNSGTQLSLPVFIMIKMEHVKSILTKVSIRTAKLFTGQCNTEITSNLQERLTLNVIIHGHRGMILIIFKIKIIIIHTELFKTKVHNLITPFTFSS